MKKKFVLRVDEEVYDAIERWAADDFRSVNGQIEWILSDYLKLKGRFSKNKSAPSEEDSQSIVES